MASNLGRIVAHAGHPARLTDAAASTSSTAASTYTVAYRLHVCASRNLCTSVYQHRMVQVRDTLLQSFRLYHPVLTDISKQSLEVK